MRKEDVCKSRTPRQPGRNAVTRMEVLLWWWWRWWEAKILAKGEPNSPEGGGASSN